jgi:hypothetical protein
MAHLMEISMYGRTDFVRPYGTKKKLTDKPNNRQNTETLDLKELKFHQIYGS